MAYDVTFLQSNFTPVASGLGVTAYLNPTGGGSAAAVLSGNVAASGTTDANGHVSMVLPGSENIVFVLAAYSPASAVTPANPSPIFVAVYTSASVTIVTGTLQNEDGTPQVGATVTANLNASGPVLSTNLILAQTVSVQTDSNGHWSMKLIPNDSITEPRNTLYTFVFTLQPTSIYPTIGYPLFTTFGSTPATSAHSGASIAKAVRVPAVPQVDFATLV